jgi:hypothetical protein
MPTDITADIVVATLTNVVEQLLREELANNRGLSTAEWTQSMLGALAQLGEDSGHCVEPAVSAFDATNRVPSSEFLWDLTISTWPRLADGYAYPSYFQRQFAPELVLVAESEWGNLRSGSRNGIAVLEDFSKLLAARCPLKVMVFSYHHASVHAECSSYAVLERLMSDLVNASVDDATYVLFGVAWDQGPEPFRDRTLRRGDRVTLQ